MAGYNHPKIRQGENNRRMRMLVLALARGKAQVEPLGSGVCEIHADGKCFTTPIREGGVVEIQDPAMTALTNVVMRGC